MRLSNIKVEQINDKSEVVIDYGEILTKNEIADIILKCFKNSEYKNGYIYGGYFGKKYCIYFKNVSYLGTPHPIFKKRIQIGTDFKELYNKNLIMNIQTLLIGVYKYNNTILFVDFDITKYVNNKAHNSSAHVYSIDLKNGLQFGAFQKEDINKNIITVFNKDNVERYFLNKFEKNADLRLGFVSIFDDFYSELPKTWYGITAYQEMIAGNFNNALQPEWPGFYHEFKLADYIEKKHLKNVIEYRQNKKKGEVDLDLYFPQLYAFGDLKAHSNNTNDIQGNDLDTIMNIIENKSIYYVVCNHNTESDRNHGYEVTVFWNKILGKDNLYSYKNKMKNSVKLTSYCILEINKFNKDYLDIFKQGHNSNGKPRKPKILIKKNKINNFLIHKKEL